MALEGKIRAWQRPQTETHRFLSGVGFCSACNRVEGRNLDDFAEHVPEIRKLIFDQRAGRETMCKICGYPVNHEEAGENERCPWCGNK